MVSFTLTLLLFAVGIPLLLMLILLSPLIGMTVVAVVCINWFLITHFYRKHERFR